MWDDEYINWFVIENHYISRCIPKHHIIYLEHTQFYLSVVLHSIRLGRKTVETRAPLGFWAITAVLMQQPNCPETLTGQRSEPINVRAPENQLGSTPNCRLQRGIKLVSTQVPINADRVMDVTLCQAFSMACCCNNIVSLEQCTLGSPSDSF